VVYRIPKLACPNQTTALFIVSALVECRPETRRNHRSLKRQATERVISLIPAHGNACDKSQGPAGGAQSDVLYLDSESLGKPRRLSKWRPSVCGARGFHAP